MSIARELHAVSGAKLDGMQDSLKAVEALVSTQNQVLASHLRCVSMGGEWLVWKAVEVHRQ